MGGLPSISCILWNDIERRPYNYGISRPIYWVLNGTLSYTLPYCDFSIIFLARRPLNGPHKDLLTCSLTTPPSCLGIPVFFQTLTHAKVFLTLVLVLQEGGPPPGPDSGLLSNAQKWIFQGNTHADHAKDFIGKRQGERTRRTALPWGLQAGVLREWGQFPVVFGQSFCLSVLLGGRRVVHPSHGFQWEGRWKADDFCLLLISRVSRVRLSVTPHTDIFNNWKFHTCQPTGKPLVPSLPFNGPHCSVKTS